MHLKLRLAAAAAVFATAVSAHAAVIPSLTSVTPISGVYMFNYQGTLSGDAGLTTGSKLVIFDFLGYVAGSVFSPYPTVTASTELTSSGLITIPGQIDDPALANLVFTYNGPDFQTSGGPYVPVDFNGIGARSIYSGLGADTFAAISVKNNPDGKPGGTGTLVYDQGFITVPAGAVPEPATWAMMILGLGGAGAVMRRRRARIAFA